MANFSKNRIHIKSARKDYLSYDIIKRISEMHLIDKEKPSVIARELKIPYNYVIKICSGTKQNDLWVDAVADLIRKDLLDD